MKLRPIPLAIGVLTLVVTANSLLPTAVAQAASSPSSENSNKQAKDKKTFDKPPSQQQTAGKSADKSAGTKSSGGQAADGKPATAKPAAKKADKAAASAGKASAKPGDKIGDKKRVAADTAKEEEKTSEKEAKRPATYIVKKRPFKIDVNLDGTFEADETSEVALHAQEWIDFEVLKAVAHGTRVKAGELLVSIETEKIDRAIADLQREQAVARLALREAELQLESARSMAPMDLWMTQRTKRLADEDLDYFVKVDRPFSERMAAFLVKNAENELRYETEELKQLEKMYKADDLMEDTEEIILKRARDNVERAKFMVERAKNMRDSVAKLALPRAQELVQFGKDRQEVETKKAKELQPMALKKLELALEKLKTEGERSEKKLKRLTADRQLMNVKAPISGIVYYGRFTRGRWNWSEMTAEKLRRGGRVSPDDVFMTIVAPRPVSIRTGVPEKQLHLVAAGQKAIVTPTGYPDLKLSATLQRVSRVPAGGRDFDATLTILLDDTATAVMPGMACDVKLQVYRKAEALAVPASAVNTDEDDPTKHYVSRIGKSGKPLKHAVTIGKRSEKLIEIVHGLREGDEILKEYPQEKDKEKEKESDKDS